MQAHKQEAQLVAGLARLETQADLAKAQTSLTVQDLIRAAVAEETGNVEEAADLEV